MWNKQRKDEVLLDIEDVALGNQTKLRWNEQSAWIWSATVVHEALVDPDTFAAAQTQRALPMNTRRRSLRVTRRPYVLRGLIHCGVCDRKMEGTWAHEMARYRCKYPTEYALANGIEHPRTVYVREDAILPPLDAWLSRLFAPENRDATLDALMTAAGEPDTGLVVATTAARKKIVECDKRIGKYRAALEAGADPALVTAWLTEVQAERTLAETQLQEAPAPEPLRRAALADQVRWQADALDMLQRADPDDKADLYARLGLRMTYQPDRHRLIASYQPNPCTTECVRGGI